MDGAVNFRDLGGYPTAGGKQVKWGMVYRSDALDKLSERDLQIFDSVGVDVVCDFRGGHEVKEAPNRIPSGVQTIWLPAGSQNIDGWQDMFASIASGSMEPSQVMTRFYSEIDSLPARYVPFFAALLEVEDDAALLFHCSAGKDRTGIAAALFLTALGVEQDYVMADYLASNHFRKSENERLIAYMSESYQIPEAYGKAIAGVESEYLEATFAAMEAYSGSVANYIAQELGMDEEKIEALQRKYLEAID